MKASVVIGKTKISYVQVLYQDRYFVFSTIPPIYDNIVKIPSCNKEWIEAFVEGLCRQDINKYSEYKDKYKKFLDRVEKKDKWLDRN